MADKKQGKFIERLSFWLVLFSAAGAFLVLLDPIVTFAWENGTSIKIGGQGFADQMKGAVVMLVLIAGFTAVVQYWLGASSSGDKAQDSVNQIAAAAAPAQAAAVAAATGQPPAPGAIAADTVNVAADTANVTENPKGTP